MICISLANEGKTQVGRVDTIGWTRFHPKDHVLMCQIWMKWLWDPHVEKFTRNIVVMGTPKIIEQMGITDPKYR
jgi:hypothetical protein